MPGFLFLTAFLLRLLGVKSFYAHNRRPHRSLIDSKHSNRESVVIPFKRVSYIKRLSSFNNEAAITDESGTRSNNKKDPVKPAK